MTVPRVLMSASEHRSGGALSEQGISLPLKGLLRLLCPKNLDDDAVLFMPCPVLLLQELQM